MKTIIKALAVTTSLSTSLFAPLQAQAAIENLPDCYAAVLNWCEETFPNHDCSQSSGLDECDEVFGNASIDMSIDQIIARPQEDGSYALQFVRTLVELEEDARRHNNNDDDDDDRDSTGRPSNDQRDPAGVPARN